MCRRAGALGAGFVLAALVACRGAEGRGGDTPPLGPHPSAQRFVVEQGVLEAIRQRAVIARRRGQITWLIPEGTFVRQGDKVLELEHEEELTRLEDTEVSLREAEARVTELTENLTSQRKELEQEVAAARSALEVARFRLKTLEEGPTPATRAEARARVEKARAALAAAEDAYRRAEGLVRRQVISREEARSAWAARERARLDLKLEELNWELLTRGPQPVALARAKLEIQAAEVNLAAAQERLEAQLAGLKRQIEEARLTVARLQDQVRRLRRRIQQAILTAPGPGMVVYGSVGFGHPRKIEVGARVWPGISLILLPDLSAYKVATHVGEEVVGSLRVGQRVRVEVPSVEGATYTGEILRIDVWGRDRNELLDDTGKKAEGLYGSKVYAVEVKILEQDPRLNLGFKARVYFPRPAAAGEVAP